MILPTMSSATAFLQCFALLVIFIYVNQIYCKGGGGRGGGHAGGGRGGFGGKSGGARSGGKFGSSGRSGRIGVGYIPLHHSHYMQRSINNNVEMCNDFYEHACGNWISSMEKQISDFLPVPLDQYNVVQNKIDRNIRTMLQNSKENSPEVNLFQKCDNQG